MVGEALCMIFNNIKDIVDSDNAKVDKLLLKKKIYQYIKEITSLQIKILKSLWSCTQNYMVN